MYLADHPVIDSFQSATDIQLINTQTKAFGFGKFWVGCSVGGRRGVHAAAGEGGAAAEELESEVTQVVRQRIRPVRPFAPTKVNIQSLESANEDIGQIIDSLFDTFPNGEP